MIILICMYKKHYNPNNIHNFFFKPAHWPSGRAFANGPGDLGSIPGRVIQKTFRVVLDTSLFNTQQYKVCIKGKVEQSGERSSTLPYTSPRCSSY